MEKLLNEENEWDHLVTCDENQGMVEEITKEEVTEALCKMKKGKGAGYFNIVVETIQAACEVGINRLTDLCNWVVKEQMMPEDWKRSIMVPIFKGKGGPNGVWIIQSYKVTGA
jgi:hypothetical protein